MDNKNCEILFEYLRSILYDAQVQTPSPEMLEPDYRKLFLGLQYLEQAITEMKIYSEDLSRGNLSAKAPSRENTLCENLKNIHANLNHLTWQAKQVAKGDYSQTVSYLGEFSEAFNTMTSQLAEREDNLKEEAIREKEHAELVENYNNLLVELISRSREEVLIISTSDERCLYFSKTDVASFPYMELHQYFLNVVRDSYRDNVNQSGSTEWNWKYSSDYTRYYHIISISMVWQGEKAVAHIIQDITSEKLREQQLQTQASIDPLTGISNRYCFIKYCKKLLDSGRGFIFCYCDLDYLKYVNDNYGHLEGDTYICDFVKTIRAHIRDTDMFARIGGDEFCVILYDCGINEAEDKFSDIQKIFRKCSYKDYPRDFSIGMITIEQGHAQMSIETIIKEADQIMYAQKNVHHKNRTI